MKRSKLGMAAAATLLLTSMTGFAAEPQGWKFEFTPYAWLAGVDGNVTVAGHRADFDKSFSDLLDYVKVGGSALGVAQYNRFLLWGQVDYLSMGTGNITLPNQALGFNGGSVDMKALIGELAVGYQLDGFMEGQTFDVLVGARFTHVESDLNLNNPETTFSSSRTLTDPMLLLRPSIPICPSMIKGLRFNPTFGIGGGGSSDLVYELQPQLQYDITENVAVRFGYRVVGYKFKGDKNSDNEFNFQMDGLLLGLGVKF